MGHNTLGELSSFANGALIKHAEFITHIVTYPDSAVIMMHEKNV